MNVSNITRYWKFVVAAGGFVLTLVQALVADPTIRDVVSDNTITSDEGWRLVIAGVTALLVLAVPNTRPAGKPHDPDISEQDR